MIRTASPSPLDSFQPAVRRWFEERLGEPSPPQQRGLAAHSKRAAHADRRAHRLRQDARRIPLGARRAAPPGGSPRRRDPGPLRLAAQGALQRRAEESLGRRSPRSARSTRRFPRSACSCAPATPPSSERASMMRRPPHVLVTTPESLYILLTSDGGRAMLRTVRTVIVDEIHSLARDKRGSHLALSLERLEALAGPVQRIGLSATQKPLEARREVPGRRGPRVRARRRRPSSRDRSCGRGAALGAFRGVLARNLGRDLRAHGRAHSRASHHAALRLDAQDGRAPRRPPHHAPRRQPGHLPSREPLERAPPRRRAAAEARRAARVGRDRVHGAGARHRRHRSRHSSRRVALHRDVAAARGPRRPRSRACSQGAHLPAHRPTSSWRRQRCFARCARASWIARRSPATRSTFSRSKSSRPAFRNRGMKRSSMHCCGARGPIARWSAASSRARWRCTRRAATRSCIATACTGRCAPPAAHGFARSPAAAPFPTSPTIKCASSLRAPSSARSTKTSPWNRTAATCSSWAMRRGGSCASIRAAAPCGSRTQPARSPPCPSGSAKPRRARASSPR